MTENERACVVRIREDQLTALFGLPPGAKVAGVWDVANDPGVWHIRVVGVGPEVKQGNVLVEVQPIVKSAFYFEWGSLK